MYASAQLPDVCYADHLFLDRWSGYCFMKDIEEAERRRKALINDLQDEELGPAVKVWKAEVKERNEKFRAVRLRSLCRPS